MVVDDLSLSSVSFVAFPFQGLDGVVRFIKAKELSSWRFIVAFSKGCPATWFAFALERALNDTRAKKET